MKKISCVGMWQWITWLHYYIPESKMSLAAAESRLKRPKTQKSAGKVMACVFWDAHGILVTDYLGKTINSECYIRLFDGLSVEIKI